MKKINLIIAFLAIIAIQLVSSTDGDCAENPFLEKMEAFAQKLERGLEDDDDDETQATELTNALAAYREGDGDAAPSAGDFEICEDFEGSNSCCTDTLVDTFPKVIKRFVKSKLRDKKKKPVQKIFLQKFIGAVGKCISKEKAKEFQESEAVQAVFTSLKGCHRDILKNQARIIAGSLCALCFNPTQFTTSFNEDGQLNVSEDNYEEFSTAINGDFTCFNDLNQDIFSAIEDILGEFPEDGKCMKFKEKIQEIIESDELDITPPSNCGERASAFGEGCAGDQERDQDDFEDLDPSSKNVGKFKPPRDRGDDDEKGGKGGKGGDGPSEEEEERENPPPERNLTEDDSSDFNIVDDAGAYEVFADQDQIAADDDLFQEEDEVWDIEEDDLPEYDKDLTISGSTGSCILQFGMASIVLLSYVLL